MLQKLAASSSHAPSASAPIPEAYATNGVDEVTDQVVGESGGGSHSRRAWAATVSPGIRHGCQHRAESEHDDGQHDPRPRIGSDVTST
jgi:hypothetical protein